MTFVRTGGAGAIPPALTTYQIVSFESVQRNIGPQDSTRKTRDIAKLARADAGVIAEEAREMRRLRKAKTLAELAERCVLAHDSIERALHADDVEIELWRDAERGLEQAEELRAREACALH